MVFVTTTDQERTMTDRTAEIAHDTKFYELLMAEYGAAAEVERQSEYLVAAAATDPESSRYNRKTLEARTEESAAERFAVGTVYYLSPVGSGRKSDWDFPYRTVSEPRTFGDRIVHMHSRATAADALGVLPADHERVVAYNAARDALVAARDAVDRHDRNGYTGWTRYMLVTSSAGHVHRDTHCSTCNMRTTFAPVVALSGADADEAIELLGETLCSVCYPDAPVAGKLTKITKSAAKKILAVAS